MAIPLFQVDAFTAKLYRGNPAAVCLLTKRASSEWMQCVAAEMNVSETAFVWPQNPDKKISPVQIPSGQINSYHLKWFTPTTEVSLCGHATLATASILWQEQRATENMIRFDTLSGVLLAEQQSGSIELTLPSERAQACDNRELALELLDALGVDNFKVLQGEQDFMVVAENPQQILDLSPNFERLVKIQTRAIIVTAASEKQSFYDFVARVFVPSCGINEDPVTGSAYCLMGPYWAEKMAKSRLKAQQLSQRGGELEMTIKPSQILLRGKTRTAFKGELYDNE